MLPLFKHRLLASPSYPALLAGLGLPEGRFRLFISGDTGRPLPLVVFVREMPKAEEARR